MLYQASDVNSRRPPPPQKNSLKRRGRSMNPWPSYLRVKTNLKGESPITSTSFVSRSNLCPSSSATSFMSYRRAMRLSALRGFIIARIFPGQTYRRPLVNGIYDALSGEIVSYRSGTNFAALSQYRGSRWMVYGGTKTIVLPGMKTSLIWIPSESVTRASARVAGGFRPSVSWMM